MVPCGWAGGDGPAAAAAGISLDGGGGGAPAGGASASADDGDPPPRRHSKNHSHLPQQPATIDTAAVKMMTTTVNIIVISILKGVARINPLFYTNSLRNLRKLYELLSTVALEVAPRDDLQCLCANLRSRRCRCAMFNVTYVLTQQKYRYHSGKSQGVSH